ncbi:MAG: class I SAM-dependent methyltransferase [Flavobacteriaceae bacterium]
MKIAEIMENSKRRDHWEEIYQTKETEEVSWYQKSPKTSLELIQQSDLPKTARIIDMGGGDSLLVDNLLEMGFNNISVVDISETALNKSRERLGAKGADVNWIQGNATRFHPPGKFDLWHDRATFHFLIHENKIDRYLQTAYQHINPEGILLLGTFSEKGPHQCSGLPVNQYSSKSLVRRLEKQFEIITCKTIDHFTPTGSAQNFLYCIFRRKSP